MASPGPNELITFPIFVSDLNKTEALDIIQKCIDEVGILRLSFNYAFYAAYMDLDVQKTECTFYPIAIDLKRNGLQWIVILMYQETSNISRTLVGTKIVDHSDVVGASPVGAAPTTSSFST